MTLEFRSIEEVLAIYFDGLHHSDSARLSRVFHPQALYACATESPLLHLNMRDYFAVVDQRPSPASRNEKRNDRILSIEFAGPVTALARVECSIGAKFFTDLLTLVKVEGRWQIMAKVFHYDVRP